MNAPHKPTFKLSLLDCFVIMFTLSIVISVDVAAFNSEWNGKIDSYWWHQSSALDGLIPLFLFHVFTVMCAVMYARTIRALYRKEKLGADDPVPFVIEPVAGEEMPPPLPEVTETQRAVGCVIGGAFVLFGIIMSIGFLGMMMMSTVGYVSPEHAFFVALSAFGSLWIGTYLLRFINPRTPQTKIESVATAEARLERPMREPMEIQNWFVVVAIILFLLVVALTINNAMKNL